MPHARHSNKKKKIAHGAVPGEKGFSLRGRLWVDGPEGTFLGYGRVVLMERIREHGSITKAAKSMDMSYRHAWRLIDSMNRQSSKPYVVREAGGRNGGGTRLTEEGERAIEKFWLAQELFRKFLDDQGAAFIQEEQGD